MTQGVSKLRIGPVHYFSAAPVRYLVLSLFSIVLLIGCSTVATYKPNTAAGPAKPVGYPILVYMEDMTVPRPCEVIGTISIGDTRLTMFGGSVESEMKKVMQTAREKGADAVQMKSVEKPDFSDTNYRLVAELLRYTDTWETVAISEQEFVNYLKTNRRNLDLIEGVWDGYGQIPHRIGIMRNTSKPGRDFIAFILNTEDPTWRKGYKKIDIQRGTQPGTYIFDYYPDDFSKRGTTVILGRKMTFTLTTPTSDEKADIIAYSKSR
ncbi:MAG: hypothetical protein ABSD57_05690 [Verrucomicrobiota bacterium]|jgi:hypothetical protein